MEEEIIIVIKPRRAAFQVGSASQNVPEPVPTAYSFDNYEAAVKFLAANLKG